MEIREMKTLTEQLKENKGCRFYNGDVMVITSTPNMVSNHTSFEYHSPFQTKKSIEYVSFSNDIDNWKWLKGVNEGGHATVLYQHWEEVDGEYVEVLTPYEDSIPYRFRFIPSHVFEMEMTGGVA